MDDLISRQDAIDEVKKHYRAYDNDLLELIAFELKWLPSAQPEPSTEIQEILNYLDTVLHPIVSPDNWNVYAELHDMISALPSAQPETNRSEVPNGWIPVTERLPEPRIDVWCNSDLGQMVGYYDETVEIWYGRDYLELMVTAWMPLPEPYREEEQDD